MIEVDEAATIVLIVSAFAAILISILTFQNTLSVIGNVLMFMTGIVFGVSCAGIVLLRLYDMTSRR